MTDIGALTILGAPIEYEPPNMGWGLKIWIQSFSYSPIPTKAKLQKINFSQKSYGSCFYRTITRLQGKRKRRSEPLVH